MIGGVGLFLAGRPVPYLVADRRRGFLFALLAALATVLVLNVVFGVPWPT